MSLVRQLGRLAALTVVPACVGAQPPAADGARELPRQHAPRPTTAAITEQDLMTRLYIFADDSMQGRATGTEGYRKGTDYIAAELKRLGLRPAGEGGTYFQPMPSRSVGAATRLTAGGAPLALWKDFAPVLGGAAPRAFEGAGVIFGGTTSAYAGGAAGPLAAAQANGKVVVLRADNGVSPRTLAQLARGPLAGAASIAVIGLEQVPPMMLGGLQRPSFAPEAEGEAPAILLVTADAAQRLLGADPGALQPGAAGPAVSGAVVVERGSGAARNVVAVWPGSDPRLAGQYVALGAHADHVGFSTRPVDHDSLKVFNQRSWQLRGANNDPRPLTPDLRAQVGAVNVDSLRRLRPARPDSISNGADDDGSGSMALLEIAEAFAAGTAKPKRSVLFVWHAGEELGMLGSEHFTDHPTVPRDSIVAQINIDMIGRGGAQDLVNGGPGYLGVVGSRRLSTQLGDIVEQVNTEKKHGLTFDYGLDANGHPQNIYCRSDHYSYARYGIPIVFFFTGLHADYHQVTDEPQYILYPNYARITNYIRDLTLTLADRAERPVVDKPKPDPTGRCQQ